MDQRRRRIAAGARVTAPALRVVLTLTGEPSATLRALRHVLKGLLRAFGVRVVELRPLAAEELRRRGNDLDTLDPNRETSR